MAINRAERKQNQALYCASKKNCVFISHKKEDLEAAKAIGEFLLNQINVDIYLDIYDITLQEAVSLEKKQKIVESIRTGLSMSTHLLCLVSDKTHLSWWVPYEIGIASNQEKRIASLKLKGTEDIPSFLKTEKVLMNIRDFLEYSKTYNPYNGLFLRKELNAINRLLLDHYVDR